MECDERMEGRKGSGRLHVVCNSVPACYFTDLHGFGFVRTAATTATAATVALGRVRRRIGGRRRGDRGICWGVGRDGSSGVRDFLLDDRLRVRDRISCTT